MMHVPVQHILGAAIVVGLAASAASGWWGVASLCFCGLLALVADRNRELLGIQRPKNGCMWGYITIPQGERWNVCTTAGSVNATTGPRVMFVWGDQLTQLEQVSATQAQYLWVQFLDGRADILPGPSSVYQDRTIHKQVQCKDVVSLTDNEVLVVYRDEGGQGDTASQAVVRHIVRGPCLYMPKNAAEWIHEFKWHGSISNDDAGRKVKGARQFTKLRVCPEQTYFDIEAVRTKDDALLTVKVMIFYRLADINTMLRETNDPPADFTNSVASDVIDIVAGKSFEEFKVSTDSLNDLGSYPQLTSRAMGIGFEVTKVVFRGYGAPQRLQRMHDDAIERRTQLGLERENVEQEQKMQDMKQAREEERLRKRHTMEKETKTHERELQRAAHEAKQREALAERQARLEHLSAMKVSLGISGDRMAAYMLASEQGPPSKVIQLVGSSGKGLENFVHLNHDIS